MITNPLTVWQWIILLIVAVASLAGTLVFFPERAELQTAFGGLVIFIIGVFMRAPRPPEK